MLLSFLTQNAKKNFSAFCHSQLQWKVMERLRNSIGKCLYKNRSDWKNTSIEKKTADRFVLFICLSTQCQNLGAIRQIPFEFYLFTVFVASSEKNWFEKTALNISMKRVIFTFGQNLNWPPFLCQYLILFKWFLFYIRDFIWIIA